MPLGGGSSSDQVWTGLKFGHKMSVSPRSDVRPLGGGGVRYRTMWPIPPMMHLMLPMDSVRAVIVTLFLSQYKCHLLGQLSQLNATGARWDRHWRSSSEVSHSPLSSQCHSDCPVYSGHASSGLYHAFAFYTTCIEPIRNEQKQIPFLSPSSVRIELNGFHYNDTRPPPPDPHRSEHQKAFQ